MRGRKSPLSETWNCITKFDARAACSDIAQVVFSSDGTALSFVGIGSRQAGHRRGGFKGTLQVRNEPRRLFHDAARRRVRHLPYILSEKTDRIFQADGSSPADRPKAPTLHRRESHFGERSRRS